MSMLSERTGNGNPPATRLQREETKAHPEPMHRYIQTTNATPRLWSLVRQRSDQIDVFTTETSCLTIGWATIQDIRLHTISL